MAKRDGTSHDNADAELSARAAWLHYVGGLTQSEVAGRLGVSGTRAHRLIARAQAQGLVHISVDASAATCVALEDQLAKQFELSVCRVAMDLSEPGGLPLRSLGALGGSWFDHVLDSKVHEVIGIGHGRTLAAMVEALRTRQMDDTSFVSLLGGLTRSLSANPYDVIHRLAQKTRAASYLMPAPLFTDSAQDRKVLLSQRMLSEAVGRMRHATLAIVGIGDLLTSSGAEEAHADTDGLREAGAVAEVLGQFLDASGAVVSTPFDGRTMALDLDDLRGREVVAITGGHTKITPVKAALKSGLLTGLIIDEGTARALVEQHDGEEAVVAA